VLNARIRRRWLTGRLKVGVIGPRLDLTYKYEHLGAGAQTLKDVAEGAHSFAATLKAAKNPMLIVGMGALARADGAAVLAACRQVAEGCGLVRDEWNGFNVLHAAAARVAGMDLGFLPGEGGRDVAGILDGAQKGEVDLVWLLGADEIDSARLGGAFVVYQGHHGDRGAHRADVILPGAAYAEKDGLWVNLEGRVQLGRRATSPPGDAREDWTILRAFSDAVGKRLPYDNLGQLRRRMAGLAPHFGLVDEIAEAPWAEFGRPGPMDAAPFETPIRDFYLTNPICRASETMAECSRIANEGRQAATGTDG